MSEPDRPARDFATDAQRQPHAALAESTPAPAVTRRGQATLVAQGQSLNQRYAPAPPGGDDGLYGDTRASFHAAEALNQVLPHDQLSPLTPGSAVVAEGPNPVVLEDPPMVATEVPIMLPDPPPQRNVYRLRNTGPRGNAMAPGTTRHWFVESTQPMFHGQKRQELPSDTPDGSQTHWELATAGLFRIGCEERTADGRVTVYDYFQQVERPGAARVQQQRRESLAEQEAHVEERIHRFRQRQPGEREDPVVAIQASYTPEGDHAHARALSLFMGPSAAEPGRTLLLDFTVDTPRRDYAGATPTEALLDFKRRNQYANGLITMDIPRLGRTSFATHGRQDLAGVVQMAGIGIGAVETLATGLAAAGVASAGTLVGAPVAVPLFVASLALYALGAGIDWYEEAQNAERSSVDVWVDIIGLAGSLAGGAVLLNTYKVIRLGRLGEMVALSAKLATWNAPSLLVTVDTALKLRDAIDGNADPAVRQALLVRLLWQAAMSGGMAFFEIKNFQAGEMVDPNHPSVGLGGATVDAAAGFVSPSNVTSRRHEAGPSHAAGAEASRFSPAAPGSRILTSLPGPLLPGTEVTYLLSGFSDRADFAWRCENDPATVVQGDLRHPPVVMGPRGAGKSRWDANWSFPGRHTIKCTVTDGGQTHTVEFEQLVVGTDPHARR
jgi:hypothetical protein